MKKSKWEVSEVDSFKIQAKDWVMSPKQNNRKSYWLTLG
jgi:hypothetical protein